MANPTLEVRDARGALLASNDDWREYPGAGDHRHWDSADERHGIGHPDEAPSEGAAYTAIVRGVGDTTGIAVVEMYALPPVQ